MKDVSIIHKQNGRELMVDLGDGVSEVSDVALSHMSAQNRDTYHSPSSGSGIIALTQTLIFDEDCTANKIGKVSIGFA